MKTKRKPHIFVESNQVNYFSNKLGYHAFFVVNIPFIPSFYYFDQQSSTEDATNYIDTINCRFKSFLHNLRTSNSFNMESIGQRAIEMRYVLSPKSDNYGEIKIYIIGKAFSHLSEDIARRDALELWDSLRSQFPSESPYDYPINTVWGDNEGLGSNDFENAFTPISVKDASFVEIIKHLEYDPKFPNLMPLPHAFSPPLKTSGLQCFLETFARQEDRSVVSICLTPYALSERELDWLNQEFQNYKEIIFEDDYLISIMRDRVEQVGKFHEKITHQRNHLWIQKIQIITESSHPSTNIALSLASEIIGDETGFEQTLWDRKVPVSPVEKNKAFINFNFLEYNKWWEERNPNRLFHWFPWLCTTDEVVGSFRLPIPFKDGNVPGIEVQDNPFVIENHSGNFQTSGKTYIPLGKMYHKGLLTNTDYMMEVSDFCQHGLIAGQTRSGKSNTCMYLLSQLYEIQKRINFLIIYPINKTDYRQLLFDEEIRDRLLIFTVGDETTFPLRFNPFIPPDEILIRTHVSYLMRAFSAAFSMWDPLPMIFRKALYQLYKDAGCKDIKTAKGKNITKDAPPTLSRFYEIISMVSAEIAGGYKGDVRNNIHQATDVRISDLIQNWGDIFNVDKGLQCQKLLEHPTVLELGKIGNEEDMALVMGLLLISLSAYFEHRKKVNSQPPQHITLIEEAHTIMPSKRQRSDHVGNSSSQASEDFANLLKEVAGLKESVIIAEQNPAQLVQSAISETSFKLMHKLEPSPGFDLFSEVLDFNKRQSKAAKNLDTGEALLRGRQKPVMVKIPKFSTKAESLVLSDDELKVFMQHQMERFDIVHPSPIEWDPKKEIQILSKRSVLHMPMTCCVYCKPWNDKAKCDYGWIVANKISDTPELIKNLSLLFSNKDNTAAFDRILNVFLKGTGQDRARAINLSYCYLVHKIDAKFKYQSKTNEKQKGIEILRQFHAYLG